MKNIIILGRPRSGKSTLANLLVEKYNYQIIRLDALRDSLTKIYPELNITPDSAIEDKKYFQYINKFLEYREVEDRGRYLYAIDGCDIKLEDCNKIYNSKKSLIYILAQVDITPEEMAKNMKKYDTKYDWTYNRTEQELINWCEDSIEKARVLKKEAEQYKLKFYDTASNREIVLQQIMEDIEKNI